MLRRTLSLGLVLAMVLSAVPPASAASSSIGRISGIATTTSGAHVAGQLARLRSLDIGHVADVTTTNASGDFAFSGVSAGSYIVELVSSGLIVGTSAPITLAPKNMTVEGVSAIANLPAAAAAQAQAGALAGSFWASTAGIITAVAIAAAVVTTVVVVKNASPSR
jgi:hypothetical protein